MNGDQVKRLLIFILKKFLQNHETKEERDLRLGYDLFIEYDTNIKKVISHWSPYKSFGSRVLWQWVDKGMPALRD